MASGYYDATFKTYGNLMFYNGHAPDYFYFKSLDTYNGTTPEYAAKAKEISAAGAAALANPPTFTEGEDMPALKMLAQALDFLRQAVQYERSNEMTYFKQKFAILKDSFSKEEIAAIEEITELEDLFSHGANTNEFDYNRMIALVNILEQGLKQTKVVAQYEEERIKTIETAMSSMKQSRERQLNGLWRKQNGMSRRDAIDTSDPDYIEYMKRAEKRYNRQLTISYAEHGNLTSPFDGKKRKTLWGAKKYLADIPKTVDVVVAHWITDHIKEIFESEGNMKKFEEIAKQYLFTGQANTDTIREMLVKAIVNDGVKHTVEILEGTYKNLPTDEFIKTLTEQIEETRSYRIQGYYSNFGQYGKQLDYFNGKTLASGKEVADGLYDAYADLVKELQSAAHKTTREETMLMSAIKGQGHLQTYTRVISLIRRLEAKEKEFAKLQREIQEGRRKSGVTRALNLGSAGDGTDVVLQVKITAEGVQYEGMGLAQGLGRTSLMKKIGNGRSEAETLKGAIAGLKSKMSRSLRDDLNAAIAKAMANPKNTRTQDQITTAFEKAMTGLKLSVGGPKLSEIAPAIINALQKGVVSTHFPGALNRRNDLITITLTYNDINLETTLQQIMDKRAEDLADALDPELAEIQKQYISNFEQEFYTKMSKLKSTDANYNSLAENEKIWFEYAEEQEKKMREIEEMREKTDDLWGQYVEKARKEGKSEEEINAQRQKVLGSLKDSFFISDTMKTYNQYQNNLGFSGASLGANVHAQLSNLNALFTKAGVPLIDSDITWLESAIINCSPVSIVGEANKNIIENYLSSMAALAMFDEGSAEGQIIQDLSNKITDRAKASPNILHLYRVNGVFVPGSVVLQRTIDELSKCLEQSSLAIETVNSGAGIEIINTMNEGLIPNRSTTTKRYQTFDPDPWGTVASATDSHVKLKIMFLAKLLDIVNDMNSLMSKVEIPG